MRKSTLLLAWIKMRLTLALKMDIVYGEASSSMVEQRTVHAEVVGSSPTSPVC
jgi:hypothetical protein